VIEVAESGSAAAWRRIMHRMAKTKIFIVDILLHILIDGYKSSSPKYQKNYFLKLDVSGVIGRNNLRCCLTRQ